MHLLPFAWLAINNLAMKRAGKKHVLLSVLQPDSQISNPCPWDLSHAGLRQYNVTIKHNRSSVSPTSWSFAPAPLRNNNMTKIKWGHCCWCAIIVLQFALLFFQPARTHSLSLSCRSVRAPFGNFAEDNALDEWHYYCTQLHGDIFCPRLQFIIWNCDTDLQRWLRAERRAAFSVDKKNVIKKGRRRKTKCFAVLEKRTTTVSHDELTAKQVFLPVCCYTIWLSAYVCIMKLQDWTYRVGSGFGVVLYRGYREGVW